MSKPQPPPLGRVPSVPVPPTARQPSGAASGAGSNSRPVAAPVPSTAKPPGQPISRSTSGPRFYDGPTVAQGAEKAKAAAAKTAAVTKASSKKAVATVKRHPWSFISILTTIPFLIAMSLASTVLCPPPGPQSTINKYLLSPLGYAPESSHPTFCYPANVYHREVLQPYVYPVLDMAQARFISSPQYTRVIEPTIHQARQAGIRAWNGPVKPVVNQINRGARKFYLTFVQPHIPYFKARVNAITAPYTSRISAFSAPHIATANAYAKHASDRTTETYRYVASHPFTGKAGEYAKTGYQVGSDRTYQAYEFSRPHFLRARREAERIATEILGPRVVQTVEWSASQAAHGLNVAKDQIHQLYRTHLDPHVAPYVQKASVAAAPYTALYAKHLYNPYIKPAVDYVVPPTISPKSFLSILSDFLPTGSSHPAESRGQMDDFYSDIEHSRRPADVHVPGAEKLAKKPPKSLATPPNESKEDKKTREKASKDARGIERGEAERVRDALKARVDQQGKKGLDTVKKEITGLHATFLSKTLPETSQNIRSEVDRELEYVLRGLDKLYSSSPTLTREQVQASSEQADQRLAKTVDKIKKRLDLKRQKLFDEGKPIVRKAFDDLDAALGEEYQDLATKLSWMEGVTAKDWDKCHAVRKAADAWKDKYIAVHEDQTINKPFANLRTELDDVHESFRARLNILKRTANDRVAAREAVSAEPSRVSILPIVGDGAAAVGAGAGAIIGKGKEQVLSALSQASVAASGTFTGTGKIQGAKVSGGSIVNAASSAIHDATRSVISAAGGTPSPESPREHVESVYNAASAGAESLLNVASSSVHEATRSAMKAVGATPSPESFAETVESLIGGTVVLDEAKASASSVVGAASSGIHDATRSVIKAVGGTPSPESPREHAESAYSAAGDVAASLASSASEAVHQATRSVISAVGATPSPETFGETVESVINAASDVVSDAASSASEALHDATRAAIRAVGATPSPESPADYAQSIANAAAESAASVGSIVNDNASALASSASSLLHDATRSASKAVGATPSAESAEEYLESIANVVAEGAASVYGVVGDGIHDATRSAIKAVGATPSPETPGEYAESIYDAASSTVVSVASVASEQATLLASSIQAALGLVPTPEPIASQASSYLVELASQGSSAGSDLLASGSSILSSLDKEVRATAHSATRAASRAVGATPTPESVGEYTEDIKERVKSALGRDEL